MEKVFDLSEIDSVAKEILQQSNAKIYLFHGEMGSGKTTLIKALAKQLGITAITSSPTYGFVNEYQGDTNHIYHFDLYRINSLDEALDFGFEEYIYSGHYNFIEWPEEVITLLPENQIHIYIEKISDTKRKIILKG